MAGHGRRVGGAGIGTCIADPGAQQPDLASAVDGFQRAARVQGSEAFGERVAAVDAAGALALDQPRIHLDRHAGLAGQLG